MEIENFSLLMKIIIHIASILIAVIAWYLWDNRENRNYPDDRDLFY